MEVSVTKAEDLTFYDQMELVKSFYYKRDKLNASCGSEAMVTAKTRNRCIKIKECG